MNRSAVADRPEASDGSTDSPRAPRRSTRTAIAVAVGLLIGLGVALFVPRLLDGEDPDGAALTPGRGDGATLAEERAAAADAAAVEGPLPPGAGAADAAAAVTGFLDAEAAGDFESSFGFLGADDRRRYASPAGWVSEHADVLAPVTGYEVLEVEEAADDTAEVVTEVRFDPGLDQVTGLTPAAARVTWAASAGPDGSWGVDLEASTIEAVAVPADDVASTVRAWADDRRACQPSAGERAALVGSPALADRLCDAPEATFGPVESLDPVDAQPVVSAYGPATAAAARIVRLSGPVDLGVVLVAIGETWTVVAVVP